MELIFGEYLPDLMGTGHAGCTMAKNVVPSVDGFGPLKSAQIYSNALTAYCRGAFGTRNNQGVGYGFSGDATKLYQITSTTWSDVSKGGGYSTGTGEAWEFEKWGNKVIATNFTNAVQIITLGGANFADLGGTPPNARHIGVVKDFVVLGNTYDGTDGYVPNRVRWSGYGNEASWTVSASTQADYQDLYGNGGFVQAVVGGERGIIFQERAINIMTYVGSPLVFQFDEIDKSIGLYAPKAYASLGNTIFFLSASGFHALSGGTITPIGAGKVDRTVLAEIDGSIKHMVSCAINHEVKCVIWAYPGTGNNGYPNKLAIYNWAFNKWSHAEVNTELVYGFISPGLTMESLDNISSSLDSLPYSLDAGAYMGGNEIFSSFDHSHKLNLFSGDPMDGTIETAEFKVGNGFGEVSEVTPIADGGTRTVQIGSRPELESSTTWTAESDENSSGICPVRSNGRYHKVRLNISDTFTRAKGVDVTAFPLGGR